LLPLSVCGENAMEAKTDYKELLALFNAHKVRYLIIGAYALAFHGKDAFIRNKRALGRIKDLADAEVLGEDQ
jgi:hypothetical protein